MRTAFLTYLLDLFVVSDFDDELFDTILLVEGVVVRAIVVVYLLLLVLSMVSWNV